MPIHDLGYRPWQGKLNSGAPRWSIIARAGIRQAWKSRWLRRMTMFAWLPAAFFAGMFFIFERAAQDPSPQDMGMLATLLILPGASDLPAFEPYRLANYNSMERSFELLRERDLGEFRHSVWTWLLLTFFRYPQGIVLAMIVGLIAPPLIAQDVRSRAFLLYFSRPLARWEYIFGKAAVIGFYVAMITTLPALALYLLGVLLSPSISVVLVTWDLPLRIIGASLALMIPTISLALALSSLTTESRYATFAWFTIWALGWVSYLTLTDFTLWLERSPATRHARDRLVESSHWSLLSIYHLLGHGQSLAMGMKHSLDYEFSPLVVLASVTVLSLLIVFNRVSKPMRV